MWIQSTDYGYTLLVDGSENARWLVDQLGRSFVFRSAEPIAQSSTSSLCTFQVAQSPHLSIGKFQKLLVGIPEVTLLRVAAAG